MKRLFVLVFLLCFSCNVIVFADNNNEYLSIANDSYKYLIMDIKVEKINKDEIGNIEFRNSDSEDSNTYVINKNTIFSNIPSNMPNLQWFLDGRAEYISVVIYKTDYFEYSKKNNEKINVIAVGGFYSEVQSIGNQSETKDEFNFIFAFNIMQTDGYGKFDRENITRAEMAQILVNMLHLKEAKPISNQSLFYDVDMNHWAYDSIHICKEIKCVDGYGNGYFGTEDKITYEQAIKMLVAVLGYTHVAEENGGYPEGYINVANNIGITKDVHFVASDIATRENVARMIINSVHIPVMEQIVYSANPEYIIMDGTNGNEKVTFFDKYFVEKRSN